LGKGIGVLVSERPNVQGFLRSVLSVGWLWKPAGISGMYSGLGIGGMQGMNPGMGSRFKILEKAWTPPWTENQEFV